MSAEDRSTEVDSIEDIWIVYLLRCQDGSLYTGVTKNLPRRVDQHQAGTASRYTRSRRPVSLVYQEIQASRSLALKRELFLKALTKQQKEQLVKENPAE